MAADGALMLWSILTKKEVQDHTLSKSKKAKWTGYVRPSWDLARVAPSKFLALNTKAPGSSRLQHRCALEPLNASSATGGLKVPFWYLADAGAPAGL